MLATVVGLAASVPSGGSALQGDAPPEIPKSVRDNWPRGRKRYLSSNCFKRMVKRRTKNKLAKKSRRRNRGQG